MMTHPANLCEGLFEITSVYFVAEPGNVKVVSRVGLPTVAAPAAPVREVNTENTSTEDMQHTSRRVGRDSYSC